MTDARTQPTAVQGAKSPTLTRVVIVGAGFAGLNAAKALGRSPGVSVTLIDRRNHHLFQPLLYQVAMAGLSPADIAVPIRSILRGYSGIEVIQGAVTHVDLSGREVRGDFGSYGYDYLLLATGANHAYFGHDEWEPHAPGLKTIEQATEIRRRVLTAFELAERSSDPALRRELLTFVIVGGGPTGVELAGAIGEMTRYTLARDFRRIDPKLARIVLIEAGPRILSTFDERLSSRATRDLEALGVQVWTDSRVTDIDPQGVRVGDERIAVRTVLWAAGVAASQLGRNLDLEVDRSGRIVVKPDLSVPGHPEVFVAGDQAHVDQDGQPVPGVAPAALQQGRHVAQIIRDELAGKPRVPFRYRDKGSMATIGRGRAVAQTGRMRLVGWPAGVAWLFIHIFYLTGFRNRVFVLAHWAWNYLRFARGARLIVGKSWRASDPTANTAASPPND